MNARHCESLNEITRAFVFGANMVWESGKQMIYRTGTNFVSPYRDDRLTLDITIYHRYSVLYRYQPYQMYL